MGGVVKNFVITFGLTGYRRVVAYPYWVDTRLLPSPRFTTRDLAVWPDGPNARFPVHLSDTLADTRAKIILDQHQDGGCFAQLKQLYPTGGCGAKIDG